MKDVSRVMQSNRFEMVGELMVHGYQGVLLHEDFSGEWTVTVNVQNGLGGDGVPVTVTGESREAVVKKATDSVRRTIDWLGARAA